MVDFRFYLNKQGLRGAKGEKGDTGYSPSIVEGTNTLNEYTLKIINEFDEFETPNLRGDQIDVSDPDGTYIRYSQETGKAYVGSVDIASSDTYGMIRVSSEEDFTDFSNDSAVTPASLADNLHNYLVSPDNSVRIVQNPETSLTEITVDSSSVEGLVDRVEHLEDDTLYLESAVNDLSRGLVNTDSRVSSLNTSLNGVKQDLTTEAKTRLNADNQQQQAIDAERQQRETQDAALQTQLNSKLTADNIKQGENITIVKNGNNVTINSVGDGVTIDDSNPATDKVYSSSKTSDLVGELGNEVNSIAGRLNILEGEVKVATTENLGLVQPDGTSIVIDSDGKISSVATGTGDMTTDTAQDVTGAKTFIGETLNISDGDTVVNLAYYNNATIATKDGQYAVSGYVQMSNLAVGNFHQLHLQDDEQGFKLYISKMLDTDSIIAGENISLVKNEAEGTVTISASGGEAVPEVDNVTIEINEEGKLQTTVDINELQAKVEDLQLYKFPNATIIGTPTINNGQITDFSATSYLQFPFEFKTEGRTWLLNGSFDANSDVNTQQNIIDSLASVALAVRNGRLVLALSTNGTSFDLGEHESMSDIEPNTKYYYRLSFSGTQYLLSISTDKQEWLPEIIITSDQPIASKPMTISSSGHPFKGVINLNDYDLTVANTLVWQGMDDVGIASRMDVNASNITETGKQVIKDIAGLENIEEALDLLNGEDVTLLSTKANTDVDNISAVGKDNITRMLMPSNRYVDMELGATGSTYTAPGNGWFTIAKIPGTANTQVTMVNTCTTNTGSQAGNLTTRAQASTSGMTIYLFLPAKKGDVIVVNYSATGNTDSFRFIYAEGGQ